MAVVLQLTDGTTTVDLMGLSGPNHYVPKTAIAETSETITEVCGLWMQKTSGTIEATLTTIRSIERLLQQAEDFQNDRSGARVYVTFNPTGSGSNYRSELLRGKLDWDDETLIWKINAGYVVDVNIMWTRRAYWETAAETELSLLTSGIAAKATGGVAVYNPSYIRTATTISFDSGTKEIRDSGNLMAPFQTGETIYVRGAGQAGNNTTFTVATGNTAAKVVVNEAVTTESATASVSIIGSARNYVEIASGDVGGIVPASARLTISNTYATSTITKAWLGLGTRQTFASFVSALEWESGTIGTPTVNATCSGGSYMAITAITATDMLIGKWTLTAAQVQAAAGSPMYLVARFFALPAANTTLTPFLTQVSDTTSIATGSSITLSTSDYLQPLGILNIAPWIRGQASMAGLDVRVNARFVGGSGTLSPDCLYLLPADRWREMLASGAGCANGAAIVNDPAVDDVYVLDSSNNKTAQFVPYGQPLMLEPGKTQRIYMLFESADGTAPLNRTATISAHIRERRITI